jgi:hypothetical protein
MAEKFYVSFLLPVTELSVRDAGEVARVRFARDPEPGFDAFLMSEACCSGKFRDPFIAEKTAG